MFAKQTLLRNLRLGSLFAAVADDFDAAELYAYSQVDAATPIGERAAAARRLRSAFASMSPATLRSMLAAQNLPLPTGKVWLFRANELADRQRFQRDAANLVYLRHPRLNWLFAAPERDAASAPFVVLAPLENFAPADAAALPLPQKLAGLRRALDAVAYLHAREFYHGDLRPENIWLAANDARLLLTGIAPLVDDETAFSPARFGYVAPEILRGGEPTVAGDIYALGAILYFLAVGEHPFAGAADRSEFLALLNGGVALPPTVPPRLANIVVGAMATRYASVGELAADLDKFLAEESVAAEVECSWHHDETRNIGNLFPSAPPAPPALIDDAPPAPVEDAAPAPARERNLWRYAGVAAVLFFAFIIGGFAFSPQKPAEKIALSIADDWASPQANEVSIDIPPASARPVRSLRDESSRDELPQDEIMLAENRGAGGEFDLLSDLPAIPEAVPTATVGADATDLELDDDAVPATGTVSANATPDFELDEGLPAIPSATVAASLPAAVQAESAASQLIAEGNALMRERDYAGALAKFNEAGSDAPEIAGLKQAAQNGLAKQERKAALLQQAGELLAAQKYTDAETALLAGIDAADADIQKVLAEARAGKFRSALKEAEQNLAAQKYEDAELACAWALSVEGYGDNPQALRLREQVRTAASQNPNPDADRAGSFNAALVEAQKLLAQKDYLAAIEVFNLALAVPGYEKNEVALRGKRLAEAASREGKGKREEGKGEEGKGKREESIGKDDGGDAQFDELMRRGNELLLAGCWSDSERVFARALTIPGYAGDETALAGRQKAIAGQSDANRREPVYAALMAVLRDWRNRDYAAAAEKLTALAAQVAPDERPLIDVLQAVAVGANGARAADLADQMTLAREQITQEKYADAAATFASGATGAAQPAAWRWASGVLFALAADPKNAETQFNEALAGDANFAPALLAQALLALDARAYDAALDWIEKYKNSALASASPASASPASASAAVVQGYIYYDGGLGLTEKRRKLRGQVSNERSAAAFAAAAQLGDALAKNNLGVCYLTGRGVKRDYEQARELLTGAGDLPVALFNNGLMYFRGAGVNRDYALAANYFTQAAERGDVRAAARLADMYQRGRGVPKDPNQAARYLEQAGGQEDQNEEFALALPSFTALVPEILRLPLPRPTAPAAPDFSAPYRYLINLAERQERAGELIAASRHYALALQLPGYLDDPTANRGVTATTGKVQNLLLAADAPVASPKSPAAGLEKVNPALAESLGADASADEFVAPAARPAAAASARPAAPPKTQVAPTPERQRFYQAALDEGRKNLALQNWGYAEQAFQLALVIPGIADDAQAVDGLNRALEAKRKLGDAVKFTDFEAVLSNATSQLRDRQWVAGAYLYRYALTLDGAANEALPQLGGNIAQYEHDRQQQRETDEKIGAGSERDMATYNLAMTQAKQFMDDGKFDAAVQLLNNVLQWKDFKDDAAATALLKMATDRLTESQNSPENLAQQREKNRELYDKLIFSGKVYLKEKSWVDATRTFELARKLKGYENDATAKRGLAAANNQQPEIRDAATPQQRAEFNELLNETRDALRSGNFIRGETLARAALRLSGFEDDEQALTLLESACKAQGKEFNRDGEKMDLQGVAISEYDRQQATQAAEYQAMLGEGRRSLAMKQYEVAEAIFREILKLRGYANDAETLALLDRVAREKPRDDAPPLLPPSPQENEALEGESNAEQAALLVNEGRRALAAKNFAAAEQLFGNALDLNPQSAEAFYWRGKTRMTQNKWELALVDLKRAVETDGLPPAARAEALNNLANLYNHNQDYAPAFQYYQQAAEAGNAAAMNSLGVAFFTGRGTAADKEKAMEWYRQSAEAGDGNAMLNLGLSYDNGWTGEPDYAQARAWYEKAAEKKIPRAVARLARIYAEGLGVEKDAEKAAAYRAQAQALGYGAEK
ncbi:MAG: protein kinase [Planctomycetota bacterium]|jgi:TPR repeat protein/serine/threonine protein kinase|nr:protein kinase [Planctomycetota bacterium]